MNQTIKFSLNRTCLPGKSLADFIKLAQDVGVDAVEIRNDIEGQEFADGTPADMLRDRLQAAGLRVASVNALQRFNDCTPDRIAEAAALARYAATLGAPGIVMCPVIEIDHGLSEVELERNLRSALKQLAPVFADAGITGYVEPLGMKGSTLNSQSTAVAALDDIDGWANYAICHDTFQFWRASDTRLHPARIGLVHISGILSDARQPREFVEPDRVLVGPDDMVDNVGQLRQLLAEGYDGYVSVEPFNPGIQQAADIATRLKDSIEFVRSTL